MEKNMTTTDLENFTGLVKFTAEWCAPCKSSAPYVKKVAAEKGITLVSIDIDDDPSTASNFGVRSVPTLIAFIDGEPKGILVGAVGEKRYTDFVIENGLAPAVENVK
jgi:thioredoxin-like negative regulator of GroEL